MTRDLKDLSVPALASLLSTEVELAHSTVGDIEKVAMLLLANVDGDQDSMISMEMQNLDYLRQHLEDVSTFLKALVLLHGSQDNAASEVNLNLEAVRERLLGQGLGPTPRRDQTDVEWL
ncbi:hypothetical protein [Maritimibacter sp. DP1N21-5]|uniref:hypothetical protein n=1 Tax=Maritimibacter sp. DP1N21-5 TaxID=2836867 RepID=UPI001C44EE55|nr:hypothetical protein [Maritimibacter sp. DP1N21-5]MBV7409869.1 hypothetical protein [Maritimibacter sp. DP1N21-5]